MPTPHAALVALAVLSGAGVMGCSGGVRSVFHPSDPAFRPTPGPMPRVYLEIDLADVPKVGMRSVGLIEVRVPKSSGIERAIDVAAEKGRELGCWILIEHSTFARVEPRASLDHGAIVTLAHGGVGHVGRSPSPRASVTAEFDCIVRTNAGDAASARTIDTWPPIPAGPRR